MLRSEEIEMLVCGSPEFDMEKLKKVTIYDGYTKDDVTIKYAINISKAPFITRYCN